MTVVFLDSSAFVSLYLDEQVHDQAVVVSVVEVHGRVAACATTYAEVAGVFARHFHEGKLSEAQYGERLELFSADWNTLEVIDLSPSLSRRAGQLLKAHRSLRAMDALQLSAALEARAAVALKFLTFDTDLAAVAQQLMPDAFT